MNEHDRHTFGAIAEALAKVQAELPKLERDRTVEVQQKSGGKYSYSYVTLANLNDAILPLLAKNGLAFAAMPGAGTDGKMCLRYALLHESGERLEGEFPISGEGGIQMVGGRITYARRYVLAALVGVAADEDDESRLAGEATSGTAQRTNRPRAAASNRTAARKSAAPASEPPPLPGEGEIDDRITGPQLQKLAILAKELEMTDDRDTYLAYLSRVAGRPVESSKHLNKRDAHAVIDAMETDKRALEGVGDPPDPDAAGPPPFSADTPPTDPADASQEASR